MGRRNSQMQYQSLNITLLFGAAFLKLQSTFFLCRNPTTDVNEEILVCTNVLKARHAFLPPVWLPETGYLNSVSPGEATLGFWLACSKAVVSSCRSNLDKIKHVGGNGCTGFWSYFSKIEDQNLDTKCSVTVGIVVLCICSSQAPIEKKKERKKRIKKNKWVDLGMILNSIFHNSK